MNQIATSPQPTRAPEAVYTPPKRVDVEKMCTGYLLRHISATFNIDIPLEVRFIVLSYVQMNNNVKEIGAPRVNDPRARIATYTPRHRANLSDRFDAL